VRFIDTPGFKEAFQDKQRTDIEISDNINGTIEKEISSINMIFIAWRHGEYLTPENVNVINYLKEKIPKEVIEKCFLVFTHTENMDNNDFKEALDIMFKEKFMEPLLSLCGGGILRSGCFINNSMNKKK